jgi:hypothetical protein
MLVLTAGIGKLFFMSFASVESITSLSVGFSQNMTERWRNVLPDYEISDMGRLRNTKTQRILLGGNTKGYKSLRLKGHPVYYLHRLVAIAFLDKPVHECVVNHKNGQKQDNRVENLEWISQYDNIQHSKNMPDYQKNLKNRYPIHVTLEILKLHYVYGLRTHEIAPLYNRSYYSVRKVLTQTHHLPKALSL